jgi:serine phosphatase RsbU (regulator of sigma subunit)
VKWRIRQLEADKRILEQKVQERTIEIQHQKEEIEKQRDVLAIRNEEIMQQKEEIEAQRDEIEAQRNELEKNNYRIALQNKEIMDSIVYAKRIQTAVMPTESEILQIMPDGFIYFKPRDVVSGDFYWASQRKDKTIIVAADCTGHGVPGAFMSMLGISFLNEIVNEQEFPKANEILNELRQNVLNTLSQKVENIDMQDGMDIALAVIDMKEMQAEFAGAFNPMILIRNGELHEIPADRMPIGSHVFERESFKNNVIKIYKNDAIYLFSDGFISQFGGAEDRKFNSKAFRQLLLNVHAKPMLEQKKILDSTMTSWMGSKEQMDDILVIGVRV